MLLFSLYIVLLIFIFFIIWGFHTWINHIWIIFILLSPVQFFFCPLANHPLWLCNPFFWFIFVSYTQLTESHQCRSYLHVCRENHLGLRSQHNKQQTNKILVLPLSAVTGCLRLFFRAAALWNFPSLMWAGGLVCSLHISRRQPDCCKFVGTESFVQKTRSLLSAGPQSFSPPPYFHDVPWALDVLQMSHVDLGTPWSLILCICKQLWISLLQREASLTRGENCTYGYFEGSWKVLL